MSTTPVNTEATPGFYGKLPIRGDFLTRNLSRRFIDPYDQWLQTSIAQSRQQLGKSWLDYYLTSPLWHFALSPDACGQDAYAGVIMPSVDQVGRYYPMVIAAPLDNHTNLLALITEAWFEKAAQTALTGLDEQLELETFAAAVQALGIPHNRLHTQTPLATDTAQPAWHCPLGDLAALDQAGIELAAYLLPQYFTQYTLWWSQGSERIAPCLLICQGMPSPEGFTALLTGDWTHGGWLERPFSNIP